MQRTNYVYFLFRRHSLGSFLPVGRRSYTAFKATGRFTELATAGITSGTIINYLIMWIAIFVVKTMSVPFGVNL